jgi:hypothetical protein
VSVAVGHLDPRTEAYVHNVMRAIDAHVPVVEAYLVGSGAAGGFVPETSDVDVVVVVERELGNERRRVVDAVRTLPCPVRDLELVFYVEGAQPPSFELNLNHGEETAAEAFWFVLDAAIAQEHAVPLLHGRRWTDVFEPLSDERIREAAHASLAWSEQRDGHFARVNALRTRHYLEHGEWISK